MPIKNFVFSKIGFVLMKNTINTTVISYPLQLVTHPAIEADHVIRNLYYVALCLTLLLKRTSTIVKEKCVHLMEGEVRLLEKCEHGVLISIQMVLSVLSHYITSFPKYFSNKMINY
jgi:hypothetical protein